MAFKIRFNGSYISWVDVNDTELIIYAFTYCFWFGRVLGYQIYRWVQNEISEWVDWVT